MFRRRVDKKKNKTKNRFAIIQLASTLL